MSGDAARMMFGRAQQALGSTGCLTIFVTCCFSMVSDPHMSLVDVR
jgi:hypothetical protein